MADLSRKALVIGVSSRALFDLEEANGIYDRDGVGPYERYQQDHVDDPLEPGTAFPFVSRLLQFNTLFDDPDEEGVEVVVLSRNSPRTGLRIMNSIRHYELGITRAVFRSGASTFPLMREFNMALFLSANADEVKNAVGKGLPAGLVLPFNGQHIADDGELRVAFDFDGVLAGDSSERLFQQVKAIDPEHATKRYGEHEMKNADRPLENGPLEQLLKGLNQLQQAARASTAEHKPSLRVYLMTARSAPAHERAIRTLEEKGLTVDEAFFLGGLNKTPFLNEVQPHIFFDDQLANLENPALRIPAVHIPFGIRNDDAP
ncbi:5'-nucleotidase [Bifidobacterium sp. SMB2]|uniref:5'-nucleotidase n=1 Tax=Bifidobacterium saimiriisciurei TaxID=2661627 RepID=A0ABX0CAE1_9BIFI|nr:MULTISPECIES: 5'-nucleotidase [Bifidobacterium]NEG95260.1 5'-nucleotidase [Bifidobacterium sp. SMB2]NEH11337.1 5'-nucleotidase [Bifidobacterium saimiriisciurei]